jgi:hypothetical protein
VSVFDRSDQAQERTPFRSPHPNRYHAQKEAGTRPSDREKGFWAWGLGSGGGGGVLEALGLLAKGSKVLKVLKVMNVSGAEWGIIFTLFLSAGRQSS